MSLGTETISRPIYIFLKVQILEEGIPLHAWSVHTSVTSGTYYNLQVIRRSHILEEVKGEINLIVKRR